MKKYGLIILLFIIGIVLVIIFEKDNNYIKTGKLYINEIVASNHYTYKCKDNEYYDYIEIYNGNSYDINLEGYFLTDKIYDNDKWKFPSVTVKSHDYLLVFASGKNVCNEEECHTDFKLKKDGEYISLLESSGNIISKVTYPKLINDTSYSYSNGRYIITNPTPKKENDTKELKTVKAKDYELEITDYMSHNKGKNYLSDGMSYDWIEIHNKGEDINISQVFLSDDIGDLNKFKLPDIIIKKDEYIVVYLTNGKTYDNLICANFALSDKDKKIILSTGEDIIDEVDMVKLDDNVSLGKYEDKWYYFYSPTPGSENNTSKKEIKDGNT